MNFEQPPLENSEGEKDLETMISEAFDTAPLDARTEIEEIISDRQKIIDELAELENIQNEQLALFDDRVETLERMGLSPDLINSMKETSRLMRRDSQTFIQRLGNGIVLMIKAVAGHFSRQN